VAGTHSTGKTTFVQDLERAFAKIGVRTARVDDLAVSAREHGFPILRDHTYESTLWIMTHGISLELELAMAAPVVIVDRPVPDALGYLRAALEYRQAALAEGEVTCLEMLAKHHSGSYQVLFKTIVDRTVAIDRTKERDFDDGYRLTCAKHIENVFTDLVIPFRPLPVDGNRAGIELALAGFHAYSET
jgi:predicted ATPase